MRTEYKVAALSLAFLAGACSKRQDQATALTDDLKKDLATASASSGDLVTVPKSYQRMRFVSDIEQSRASVPMQRPKISHHHDRMTASHQPAAAEATTDVALDAVASMSSHSAVPASTIPSTVAEPSIVVAARPAPPPASAAAGSSSDVVATDQGHGGLGGLLGGIIGSVVIRGGHVGPDKCDPRTDGRARGTVSDRPDFGM